MWICFYRPIDDFNQKFALAAMVDDTMKSVVYQVRQQLTAEYGRNWREISIESAYEVEVVING